MAEPDVGDMAPNFTLTSHEMRQVSLGDYLGLRVVLAFYPGAFTAACRRELCTLRDSVAELEGLDAQVLGISVNDPFTNKAFHEENALNFPLLSDYTREVIRKYGVVHEDFAGLRGYAAAKRSVFIVDAGGVIRYRWVSEDPGAEPDYEELRRQLEKI